MENLRRHSGSSGRVANRRLHLRRGLSSLAHVELNEDNRGVAFNLGEGGLCLRSSTVLVEKNLPRISFQLPQCGKWVKLTGKIAWTGESQKEAGIQFIDLPETARIEIGEWVSARPSVAEFPEERASVGEHVSRNHISSMLALAIVSLGLMWMAFSKYAVPLLIKSAYRGESLPIFNRMISGQASHPVAEYLSDWDRLGWWVLVGFSLVSLLVLLVIRLKNYAPVLNDREEDVREPRFWRILALLACSIVLIAGIVWAIDHPYPVDWDEAQYVNFTYKDIWSFRHEGIYGLLKSILWLDPPRPPGYRLLALPVTLLFGVSPEILRLVSLLSVGISVVFVYLAADGIAGSSAGAFAAIFFSSSISIFMAGKNFGTEFVLYLAISLMLYFLFRGWNVSEDSITRWIGLGLALGLGAWAKTSFVLIAGPIMILALIFSWSKVIVGPRPRFLAKAAGLGIALASPWWLVNYRAALGFATFSHNFVRDSLGPPSLATFAKWVSKFAGTAIGGPLIILSLSLLLTIPLRKFTGRRGMNLTQITAVWICLAGALPLLLAQLVGSNHLMRLISPSLIPLAVAFGVMARIAQWTRVRQLVIIATVVLCLQLFVVVSDLVKYQFNRRVDSEQWDWEKLRQVCKSNQIYNPWIVYLGDRTSFNLPQIAYPWIRADDPVRVEWLWRYEQGKIDWEKVTNTVNSSDIVLTTPQYVQVIDGDLDNQYNAELVRRLEANSHFLKPIRLEMGRYTQVEILVFIRGPGKPDSKTSRKIPESRNRPSRLLENVSGRESPARIPAG